MRIQNAISQATSGKTFMQSSLSADGLSPEDADVAADYVAAHPDVSSYILLMALRQQKPQAYGEVSDTTKAKVLCDAMAKVAFLNDFGHLEPGVSYDGPAAKALQDVGRPALLFLRPLLANSSEAPLFGSKAATASSIYKYRRADFAYRYIMLILGRQPTFPAAPADRDELISDLQKELETL